MDGTYVTANSQRYCVREENARGFVTDGTFVTYLSPWEGDVGGEEYLVHAPECDDRASPDKGTPCLDLGKV